MKQRPPKSSRQVNSGQFNIARIGRLRGGQVNFTYHPTTGELYFAGTIYVCFFFIKRPVEISGSVNLKVSE